MGKAPERHRGPEGARADEWEYAAVSEALAGCTDISYPIVITQSESHSLSLSTHPSAPPPPQAEILTHSTLWQKHPPAVTDSCAAFSVPSPTPIHFPACGSRAF